MNRIESRLAFAFVIVTSLFFVSTLWAGAGTSSADFLKISAFSRGTAVGGAWQAVAEGTGALYYNPAGVGRSGVGEFSLSHSELYQDLKLENFSVAIPLHSGSGLGVGVSYLGYGSIDGYDISGNATGSVSAYSLLVTAAYSQRLNDNLSVGLAVKPIFERLASYTASTVTADFGVIADWGSFSAGAHVANLGGAMKFMKESVNLPTTLGIGAAYKTISGTILSVGAVRDNDGGYSLSSGIEYRCNQNLSLRGGYSSVLQSQATASTGLSFGLGLNVSSLGIDYSYAPSGALDGIHQITASYRFSK
jgi:hypothetical protein